MAKFLDSNGLVFFKTLIENFMNGNFVAKVSGKGLSTNDYTTAEKNKLANMAIVSDAEKAIWNAKSDFSGSYNDLSNKPTIPTTVASLSDAGNYALKTDLTNVYTYKGSVASVDKLPSSATKGDVYNVETDGANYAWNGSEWDSLGGSFTVTAITNAEIEAMFA